MMDQAKNDKNDNTENKNTEILQFHYRIHGRVQGVGFRNWLEDLAHVMGIDGSCRNLRDGTVEVVAKAPNGKMLASWEHELHKGPFAAEVEKVDKEPWHEEVSEGFQILPTE